MKTAVLLNDTSNELHLGCLETIKNIKMMCLANDIELVAGFSRKEIIHGNEVLLDIIDQSDFIILNGEGTFHHNPVNAEEIFKICQLKPAIMINALWQEMDIDKHLLNHFSLISVRETRSYNQILKNVDDPKKVCIVPDMSLITKVPNVLFPIGYGDSVLVGDTIKMKMQGNFFPLGTYRFTPSIDIFLWWLKSMPLYVTGRFHGICFCCLTNTSFFSLPSNSHKNIALLEDIGCPELMVNSLDEVDNKFKKAFEVADKVKEYVKTAKEKINELFRRIECLDLS